MQLFVSESCMTKQSDNEHAEDVSAHIYQSADPTLPDADLNYILPISLRI